MTWPEYQTDVQQVTLRPKRESAIADSEGSIMIHIPGQVIETALAVALVFLGQKPKPKTLPRDPRVTYVPPQNKSFHTRNYP